VSKPSESEARSSKSRTDGRRHDARKQREFEDVFRAIEDFAAIGKPRNQIRPEKSLQSIPRSNA
jgi:hypothetical protein